MKLDRFQIEAIDFTRQGKSVIVSAPTGAGKTLIAEHIMKESFKNNRGVIFTSPIKALSNQKFRDFNSIFPKKTGIVTGDVSINPDAPLLIMTTEIFRNRLFRGDDLSEKYSWIIFDEIHFIDNKDRGTVWEESLMFLPPGINFLGLSATLPNIDSLAQWVSAILKREVKVVKETIRPVPLEYHFILNGKIFNSINSVTKSLKKGHLSPKEPYLRRVRKKFPDDSEVTEIIGRLNSEQKLPLIYFTLNRKRTDRLAHLFQNQNFLSTSESKRVDDILKYYISKYELKNNPDLHDLKSLLRSGTAFHNAGMIPQLKEIVEKLFSEGLVKLVFATETFALGINMPARTVIFDELRKKQGRSFRIMPVRDFFQMAGRAGRRGLDDAGYVYSFIDRSVSGFSLNKLLTGSPEPISSRFDLSYSGILNLYDLYEERISDVFLRTFKYFQSRGKRGSIYLKKLQAKLKVLKKLNFISNCKITESGRFASELHGYELPMAEIKKHGLLDRFSPADLVYFTLALVFEPSGRKLQTPDHKRSKYLKKLTNPVINKIEALEKIHGIPGESVSLNFDLTYAANLWIKGENFYTSVNTADIDPGDLLRYFRMSSQILRELMKTEINEETKKRVKTALSFLRKGLIDADRELEE